MPKPTDRLDIAEITSPRILRLHEYWASQRASRGGLLPRRRDIAPDQIKDLLPNIMLVDVEHEQLRFRYRVVGTRVVEYNGLEFTGRYLDEIGWPEEQQLFNSYSQVVRTRLPFFGSFDWDLLAGGKGKSEFARFPLSEDNDVVSQILAIEDYDFPRLDATLGIEPNR